MKVRIPRSVVADVRSRGFRLEGGGAARGRQGEVDGREVGHREQFRQGLQGAALLGLQLADRRLVAEGQFAGGVGGGEAVRRAVPHEDDAGAQGLGLVDPVPEEVVGVGTGRVVAGEQDSVGGQGLRELRGKRRQPREFGEDRGEPAARGARGGALGPDQRKRVGELRGEGLRRIAVRGDGGSAALRRTVQPVGDLLQGLRRRLQEADAVEEDEERCEQGPERAGAGRDVLGVLVGVSFGAMAIGTNRPREPLTASASGEALGATATTEMPRR